MILKSENYNFHRLDLTRQNGFIVTVYDEDGLRLAETEVCWTPDQAFSQGRKIVDNKVRGLRSESAELKAIMPNRKTASRCALLIGLAEQNNQIQRSH